MVPEDPLGAKKNSFECKQELLHSSGWSSLHSQKSDNGGCFCRGKAPARVLVGSLQPPQLARRRQSSHAIAWAPAPFDNAATPVLRLALARLRTLHALVWAVRCAARGRNPRTIGRAGGLLLRR